MKMAEESLKHKTKIGIYWTFFNQFSNYGLQFIVGIIMARKLSPSDYGITALPVVFMVVADVFIQGGFGTAMIRKKDLNENDLSTAFLYSITFGVICYVLIFFSAPFIASFYDTPVLVPLIRVTALSFLWSPLITPQNVLLQRKLDFKTPARIAVSTKIIGACIGISLAYMGYGLWSLVIMSVVSSFLTFIQTWLAVRWLPKSGWSRNSFKYLWGFGNKLIISSLLEKIYQNIIPIILGKYFSTTDLGIYNRANGYAQLPAQQGTSVVQSVAFPVLSQQQNDDESLSKGYRKILKVTSFVIFPIMMLLSALASPLILLMLTPKWEPSIILLQIICFSAMLYPIHVINLTLLQVKGRSDLFLKLEIIKKIVGVVFIACSLPFGVKVFCIFQIVNSFISLFLNTYYTGKLLNLGFLRQMKDIIPIFILAIFTFLSAFIMVAFFEDLWMKLICGLIVGLAVYVGGAYVFKFSQIHDVKYMLNRKK